MPKIYTVFKICTVSRAMFALIVVMTMQSSRGVFARDRSEYVRIVKMPNAPGATADERNQSFPHSLDTS